MAVEQEWPKPKEIKNNTKVKIAVQINGKTKEIIEFIDQPTENVILKILKKNKKINNIVGDKEIKKVIHVPGKVINLVI